MTIILQEDCSFTVNDIAEMMDMSKLTFQLTIPNIVTKELYVCRMCTRWIPHMLSKEQL